MRYTQLLNRHHLELADLDSQLASEQKQIERGALADWEVRYAQARLELKERHYKVGGRVERSMSLIMIRIIFLFDSNWMKILN